MKKNFKIGLTILMAVWLVSCVDQGGLKAGTATGKSMLKLIPADTRGIVMVDVHRALGTDAVQNALKDEKTRQKYEEFVKMAGLDPTKDIYFLAIGLQRTPTEREQQGAIIINLKYNKDMLLAKLKDKAKDVREETYNGVTIYSGVEAGKPEAVAPAGAFLDDSNIVLGNAKGVRAVIDVYQKKTESVLKNPQMKNILKALNMSAVAWGAILIPQELIKSQADKNPMLKDLVGLTGLTWSFDYANKTLTAEIQGLGGTKEQNKSLADKLTGLKGMGAMFSAKEPVLGELVNTIEISSSAASVKIFASIPGELLDKVQKTAQEKLGGMFHMKPPAPKEEKKEEKKEGTEVKK